MTIAFSLVMAAAVAAGPAPLKLTPVPSELQIGRMVELTGQGVILLSAQAGSAERHAAHLLQRHVQRRFGRAWAVATETAVGSDIGVRVLLGRANTFPLIDQACARQNLTVPEQVDGYALSVSARDGITTAVVAGRNERGVVYGQDTLFQLLSRSGDKLKIQCATVRDWPTIPLRGRPHPHYEYYLKPENLDCISMSRLNFIDLRNDIYAFDPDTRLNGEEIGQVASEARRRGLLVYAVVNCGVPAAQHDAVLAKFRELLDLGADAIWLSFDDKGPGQAPRELVGRVLALGRERGITGNRVAITPPKGAYQVISAEFNRQVMAVSGMEQAVWYWTRVPCAQDTADARTIGLQILPSWWHNWPRFREGSLATGASRPYVPVISLREGWNHPTDSELVDAGRYAHAVLPWDGTWSQQHYLLPVIGWWSWRPERHDTGAIRLRIYDTVFGLEQKEAARLIDDGLERLYGRLRFTVSQTEYSPLCPPRLRALADRAAVTSELESMQEQVNRLAGAASASLLDPELLRREYLEPLAREVRAGLAAAVAPYPEYWWMAYQDRVLNAVYDHDLARADSLIASVRERLLDEVGEIERLFEGVRQTAEYTGWWKRQARASSADWVRLVEKRRTDLAERAADYGKTVAPFDSMVENLKDPPTQIGTGAWKRRNHVLASVLPENRERFWGDWIGGLYEKKGVRVACFALQRHTMVNEGSFAELPADVPISGRRDRLALVIYLADANKESFGLGYAKWRWSGYRAIRLLWRDQELWRADLGIPRLSGEWFLVPLPPLPPDLKTLPLRLRVEDYESAKNNFEIVYVGPILLLELDRD